MITKIIMKEYCSLPNISCIISGDVITLIENNPRKETIESKIKYLAESFSNKIIVPNKLYKKVENDIWEIRYHDVRIFCYRENDNWFLYHAMIKKADRIGNEIFIVRRKFNELKTIIHKIH
ncbi:hypothetical protein [Brachyspira intermedia]|uniref:hypothetical protein n=1 Tax=Brachyspira intermedia TaxID=84377 RepID=UPI0030067ECB